MGARLWVTVCHGPPQGPASLSPPETRPSPETEDHPPSLFHQSLGLGDVVLSRRAGGPGMNKVMEAGRSSCRGSLALGARTRSDGSPARCPLAAEPPRPPLPGACMPPTAARPTDLGSATRPGPGSAPSGNWRPVLAALGTWASPVRGADSGRPPCPAPRIILLWPWGSRGREQPPTAGSLPCASALRGTVHTGGGGGAAAPALLAGTPRLGSGPPASTR